jgi:hypothetical protein
MSLKASKFEALNELESNSSKVSFWRNIKYVIAFIVRSLEILLDKQKKEISRLIDDTETGTLSWYVDQALKFQYGDYLSLTNNRPKYNLLNRDKQIIKRAMIRETNEGLELLCVKESKGKPSSLNEDEVKAFSDYMNKVKFAGIPLNVRSLSADKFSAKITVQIDPLVFLSDGRRIASRKKEIEETVKKYLENFDFDGVFYLSKFVDTLQNIEGVEDIFVEDAKLYSVRKETRSFSRKINTISGYLEAHENMEFIYVFD